MSAEFSQFNESDMSPVEVARLIATSRTIDAEKTYGAGRLKSVPDITHGILHSDLKKEIRRHERMGQNFRNAIETVWADYTLLPGQKRQQVLALQIALDINSQDLARLGVSTSVDQAVERTRDDIYGTIYKEVLAQQEKIRGENLNFEIQRVEQRLQEAQDQAKETGTYESPFEYLREFGSVTLGDLAVQEETSHEALPKGPVLLFKLEHGES